MPIYEFECDECGYIFNHIMKLEERDDMIGSNCPVCTDGLIKSMVSLTSFRVNGYAYKNGYSKPGKRK